MPSLTQYRGGLYFLQNYRYRHSQYPINHLDKIIKIAKAHQRMWRFFECFSGTAATSALICESADKSAR